MADPAVTVVEDLESVPPESVKVIAQTVGIESLPDEVARALAPDVEYRLREVIQDSCKFMRHSKRTELSTEDVNASLKLREVESLYGFPAGAGPIPFREVPGCPEVFIQENREIELKDVLAAKLPRPPIAVNVVPHWLAVEGVQPLIPENPTPLPEENLIPDVLRAADFRAPVAPGEVVAPGGVKRPREGADTGADVGADGTVIQPVVAHELSKELQVYYDRVTAVARGGGVGGEAPLLRAALDSLATDGGLHQLMPYFVQFVSEEVAKSLKNLPRLRAMVAMTRSLVVNPAVHVELYLHQLMPGIVTCMVAKRLGANPDEDHWSLRRAAAEVMALVCRTFGDAYPTIQPRITRTLLRALLDASKPPSTHFGAVVGLSALGSRVTRLLLLPNLEAYLATLDPHLAEGEGAEAGANADATEAEKAAAEKATRKRADARRVHDALKEAVGRCMHDVLVAPRRESRERVEPARRAERQRANGDGAPAARERPPPASAVAGWTVGKNGATVSVNIGKGPGAEEKAKDAPEKNKKSPVKSPGRASKRGKATEGTDGGEDGEKVELAVGAAGEDAGDDPDVVAAQMAAAAALLGDCVLPYAADAATADAFI